MPKRKTAAQIKAQGTGRPDRARQDAQVERLEELPRVPAGLDKDARVEWKRLGAACIRRKTLSRGDLSALERASEAVAIAARLAGEAAQAPVYSIGAAGQSTINPIFNAAKSWTSEARSWLGVLGLLPSTRATTEAVAPPAEPSGLASFLTKGGMRPLGRIEGGNDDNR